MESYLKKNLPSYKEQDWYWKALSLFGPLFLKFLRLPPIFNHLIPWRDQFYVLNLFPFSFPVLAGTVIKAPGEDSLSLPTPESSL